MPQRLTDFRSTTAELYQTEKFNFLHDSNNSSNGNNYDESIQNAFIYDSYNNNAYNYINRSNNFTIKNISRCNYYSNQRS